MTRENPLLAQVSPTLLSARIQDVSADLLPTPVSEAAVSELLIYLEQVISWGSRMDLVAPRSLDELLELSLVDAAILARFEHERGRPEDALVDVGSGGGAPGIPLSIFLRHLRGSCAMTLVEPRTKRVAFLRNVAGRLAGEVPAVVRGRSDTLATGQFDVALARATLPPPQWLVEGARLARRAVWVLLAREPVPQDPGWTVEIDFHYRLPFSHTSRRAVRFVPTSSSSEKNF